jgi:small subunit ribosomal protein S2
LIQTLNPNVVDFAIPANDDASTSISLITGIIAKAIEEGLAERKVDKETAAEEKKAEKYLLVMKLLN